MAAGTAITNRDGFIAALHGEFTLDPGAIAGGANEDQTVAVPGAKQGDLVIVAPQASLDDGIVLTTPHVDSDDSITFTLENTTGGSINVTSGPWNYMVLRGNVGAPL